MPKSPKPKKWFPDGYMAVLKFRQPRMWDDYEPSPYPRFDTWAEAHQFMMKRAAQKIENAKSDLAAAERHLKKVRAMQPPAEGEKP